MKIVLIDLDGTITSRSFCNLNIRLPLPWWLFYFFVPLALLSKPKKSVVQKMQLMTAQGYQFIIVTRRPDQFFQFTKRLLVRHHVPFVDLLCVGFNRGADERKLRVFKEKNAEIFVDSSQRIVRSMRKNSINTLTSLDSFN